MKKQVTEKVWNDALTALHGRSITSEHQIPYKRLLTKVYIGGYVMDVGCGTCWLNEMLPPNTIYLGLDAYDLPQHKTLPVLHKNIEDLIDFKHGTFVPQTIFCFAALDGMRDLNLAIENMKRIARENIVFLTGVNIAPDRYHTHLITEDFLQEQFKDWKQGYREVVLKQNGVDKILFIEFKK